MKHFLNLYYLMEEWSKFPEDPMFCGNWSRKAELEKEMKQEFQQLAATKSINFIRTIHSAFKRR